jgi:hypothetical protein
MLFTPADLALPQGFEYQPDWLSQAEEQSLLDQFTTLSFSEVRMHGVVAKRRVKHFGWDYGYESWRIMPTEPIPEWLLPLRARAASLIAVAPASLEEVLITRWSRELGLAGIVMPLCLVRWSLACLSQARAACGFSRRREAIVKRPSGC